MLLEISDKIIGNLKTRARQSARGRMNHNFHFQLDDPINRMLHCINPGSYVQPHKHESPDKREIFIILEGQAAIVEFNENGEVIGHVILDRNSGSYGVEIPAGTWHCLLALQKDTIFYEVKDGPYSHESDKFFATWAPSEQDDEWKRIEYMQDLLKNLNLQLQV